MSALGHRGALLLAVLLGAAALALELTFAAYGVGRTLTWLHVTGSDATVTVTRCHDLGRGGRDCVGVETAGAHAGREVTRLAYDPAGVGRTQTVRQAGGTAVVGTPWGALWFDALTVLGAVLGVRWLVRRRAA